MVCYSITLPTEAAHLYEAVAKPPAAAQSRCSPTHSTVWPVNFHWRPCKRPVPTLKAETPTVPFPAEHSSP